MSDDYYPGPWDEWKRKEPKDVGMDAGLLGEAVAFSKENETSFPRDQALRLATVMGGKKCDDGEILGPTRMRGAPNGLVLRHGYIVAEWGETRRVDMTYSATKSYLSTCASLALERGLIRDVHDPVKEYVTDGKFDSLHNSKITWHHLLQQTNEWDGTLWGKHYSAGNPDDVVREPEEPGTHYEYNDVRVNLTALSLLNVWRRPLPQVLKEFVMDPIGASNTWRWHGYRNSWVDIDGLKMQSVSGGGHWGGGVHISSKDHARFGLLFLRRGRWEDRQLVSEAWIDMATTPGDVNPVYGYMWWVNPEGKRWPSGPETSFSAIGAGGNFIWVDREHDLVIVTRWIDPSQFDGIVKRVLAAIK